MAKNNFDIKHEIAERLVAARKAANLSIADLQERVNNIYSYSRIYNWESARRTPGVEEVLVLASILNVSPSYLMCLSDDPHLTVHSNEQKTLPMIPLFDWEEVIQTQNPSVLKHNIENCIALDHLSAAKASPATFALLLKDNSMAPTFRKEDLIIFDYTVSPRARDFVLVHDKKEGTLIFREYRSHGLNASKNLVFDLLPMNLDFPIASRITKSKFKIIATMMEARHYNR